MNEVKPKSSEGIGNRVRAFAKKLRGIRNIELILCLVLVAIALMVYGAYADRGASQAATESTPQKSEAEQKLESILSDIEGAGEVKVMIYYSEETSPSSTLFRSGGNAYREIVGVIIVAEGAREIAVRQKLIRATVTALDVPEDRVEIFIKQ